MRPVKRIALVCTLSALSVVSTVAFVAQHRAPSVSERMDDALESIHQHIERQAAKRTSPRTTMSAARASRR